MDHSTPHSSTIILIQHSQRTHGKFPALFSQCPHPILHTDTRYHLSYCMVHAARWFAIIKANAFCSIMFKGELCLYPAQWHAVIRWLKKDRTSDFPSHSCILPARASFKGTRKRIDASMHKCVDFNSHGMVLSPQKSNSVTLSHRPIHLAWGYD